MKDVQDRHTLIELGGDFTNNEIRHILNHAYLEHKSPHEYDELKKYIRDIVIGKHNSVYIMNNGNPEPLASAFVLASPYISNLSGSIYYDYCAATSSYWFAFMTNNSSNCNSNSGRALNWSILTNKYNNGNALQWGLFYTNTTCPNDPNGLYVSFPNSGANPGTYAYVYATFGYAPYVTSTNPFILTTYYYWNPGSSSHSYTYVYFVVDMNARDNQVWLSYNGTSSLLSIAFLPIFYSTGQYNFNPDTYYISMWQWTYS